MLATIAMSDSPNASAMASELYAGPAVFSCRAAAITTPVPTTTRMKVPINSATAARVVIPHPYCEWM